jgi:hypothetical protein
MTLIGQDRKRRWRGGGQVAARQDKIDALNRFIIDYEMDFDAVQRYRRLIAETIVSLRR